MNMWLFCWLCHKPRHYYNAIAFGQGCASKCSFVVVVCDDGDVGTYLAEEREDIYLASEYIPNVEFFINNL